MILFHENSKFWKMPVLPSLMSSTIWHTRVWRLQRYPKTTTFFVRLFIIVVCSSKRVVCTSIVNLKLSEKFAEWAWKDWNTYSGPKQCYRTSTMQVGLYIKSMFSLFCQNQRCIYIYLSVLSNRNCKYLKAFRVIVQTEEEKPFGFLPDLLA